MGCHSSRSCTSSYADFTPRHAGCRVPAKARKLSDVERQNVAKQKVTASGTTDFWRLYHALSPEIRTAAQSAFKKFLKNPAYPSLQLERLRSDARAWSVRVGVLKAIFQPLGKGIVQHFENGALTQYCTLTGVLFFFFWWLGYLIISHRYE